MLDDLKKMFSRSWESFVAEASRREPEDQVAELLSAMRREMVDARAALPLHEKNHRETVAELERERKRLDDTVRRGALAEKIGDAETVRVAGEFAEKHRQRVAVLEEKARVTRAEWDLAVRESEEMLVKYKHADANRFALLAEMRTQGTRARIDNAMGRGPTRSATNEDFDRFAERIEYDSNYADAPGDLGGSPPPPPRPDPADVDARLAELKRRMGM